MAIFTLQHDISSVGLDGINLFKRFIEHWLKGFCVDEFEVEIHISRFSTEIILFIRFHNEKDYLIATIKDFPQHLSKFKVIH